MADQIITEEELDKQYTFIKNHIDPNSSCDGYMFETHGAELAFVMAQNPLTIWTYQDDDNGEPCITSGYHLVNRIGYFISTKPRPNSDNIFISLSDSFL